MVSRGDNCTFEPAGMDRNVPIAAGSQVYVSSMHEPHGCRQPDYAFVKTSADAVPILVHVASLRPAKVANGQPHVQ